MEELVQEAGQALVSRQPFTTGTLYTFETVLPSGAEAGRSIRLRLSFRGAAGILYLEQVEIVNDPVS